MPNFISEEQIERAMVQRLQRLCSYLNGIRIDV